MQPLLNIFLKGTQQMKSKLHSEHPEAYSFFNIIWSLRNHHLVTHQNSVSFTYTAVFNQIAYIPLCRQKQCKPHIEIPTTWAIAIIFASSCTRPTTHLGTERVLVTILSLTYIYLLILVPLTQLLL